MATKDVVATKDDAMGRLETRVRQVVELVERMRSEKELLQKDIARLQAALEQARGELAASAQGPPANDGRAGEIEALGAELDELRAEREELRQRIGKLLELIERI